MRESHTSESALRAAAQEVVESQESVYGPCEPGCECSIPVLKAALDGALWEPSEEQVERVAQAVRKTVLGAYPWEVDDWTLVARAALKAAMGIESGSAG